MKLIVGRCGLEIYPETAQDVAYIADTLEMKKEGDRLIFIRKNCSDPQKRGSLNHLVSVGKKNVKKGGEQSGKNNHEG